ncbi:MAG: hypothetical protein K2O18_15320 [Oscillospiraceae bacterium]|nr:hypothetical protein [Oscillospiraceae bacterium]
MESKDYQNILDAMPKTGVYVIRQDDHTVLYFNKFIEEVSPKTRLGMPCHQIWTTICSSCPLLSIQGKQESRSINYSEVLGGVVDMVAARITWAGSIPAFLITVTPRVDTTGYTYRKVLLVDLNQDRCTVLKSDSAGLLFQTSGESFSSQMLRFVESGFIHPGDVERFTAFSRLSQIRSDLRAGRDQLTCIYRRRNDSGDGWRWNLMEIVPGFFDENRFPTAFLCVKDVDEVLRDGLELEEASIQQREVIRTLAGQHFGIYTLDMDSGAAEPVSVDGIIHKGRTPRKIPWEETLIPDIISKIHPAYAASFEQKFSLDALRRSRDAGEEKIELLCQWLYGGTCRYVSITAQFGQSLEAAGYAVLSFQDVDERMRRELTHSQRDMQMAAILRSRFSMMNTIDLESGVCERVSLDEAADLQNTDMGDYSFYFQQALDHFIAPEDVFQCRELLSLEHLREMAAMTEDFQEEICQYRARRGTLWLEQHVLYVRRGDQVMVHILGRDITKERVREEEHRQMLQDRSDIITSLNKLFFCVYYIDLDNNTFRTVTQLGRVGDVLGSDVDYIAASQVYAKNFIHPDDREEYLRVMCVDNLREQLRWWHPSVEMEYRRMPELEGEECTWVRASAVLGRTGSDDLPRTVVYVAQNISDRKCS